MEKVKSLDPAEEEKLQFIVVRIGDEQYGLPISYVDNIVRMSKITRVPKAKPHYLGVINLRGEVVPVMSIRQFTLTLLDEKLRPTCKSARLTEAIGYCALRFNKAA